MCHSIPTSKRLRFFPTVSAHLGGFHRFGLRQAPAEIRFHHLCGAWKTTDEANGDVSKGENYDIPGTPFVSYFFRQLGAPKTSNYCFKNGRATHIQLKKTYQVIQAVTFSSSIVGGHDSPFETGHVFTIPKR